MVTSPLRFTIKAREAGLIFGSGEKRRISSVSISQSDGSLPFLRSFLLELDRRLPHPPWKREKEEREAYVANSIEETNGKVGRVMVDGHVGLIGHGEIPQIRWWQDGLQLFIQGYLTDEEFIAIAESVQPRGQ